MLKLLPQLDEMLKPTGGKLGKIVPTKAIPKPIRTWRWAASTIVVNTRLSLQSIAKSKPDTFEVGQAVSKPTYIAWAVVKGNTELLGHAQRVPARRAQGRHDVCAAEEVVRYHLREYAGGPFRDRLITPVGTSVRGTRGLPRTGGRGGQHVAVSLLAIAIGTPLGLGLALIRWGRVPRARSRIVAALVSLLRATPAVTLVLLVYFALPTIGLEVPRFAAGVATLTLGSMAYNCEIWRAALLAFPLDQLDAARAFGMPRGLRFRLVVLPQIARSALPALVNEMTLLIKVSPAVAVIGVIEVTRAAVRIGAATYNPIPPFLVALAIYVVVIGAFVATQRMLERRRRAARSHDPARHRGAVGAAGRHAVRVRSPRSSSPP